MEVGTVGGGMETDKGLGVDELICNCVADTGIARISVFRNNHGVIEKGQLVYDL